jgi:branched-chain amino acid transport system permease protein/neutral amino acid transport system permease protein
VLNTVLQLTANGIISGAVLAMAAIGFTVMFAVLRFPNFSIGGHLAIGAYAGWMANTAFGMPLPIALICGFVVAGGVGVASDFVVLHPLRRAAPITLAIASVAISIFMENVLRFCFGNDLRNLDLPLQRDWLLGSFRVGPQQLENALLAIVAMLVLLALFTLTQTGRAMRATADNVDLAGVKGIDTERITRLVTFLGMGLAGAAGVLLGADTSIEPLIGLKVLLSVFAAAVLGGLGSIPGAVLGAFVIGIAEELSQIVVPATYKGAVGFLAILIVLSFKPSGMLGKRQA